MSSGKKVVVGVDIGGSHIGFGLIDPATCSLICTPLQVKVISLNAVADLIALLSNIIKELLRTNSVELIGVGVGVPGQCVDGVLTSAANILPGHKNVPLASMLSNALSTTVVLLNDADAYLAAEVWSAKFGEKHGSVKSAAMITLGTGIGFSLYLNGQLYEGSHGLLEGGHMIVCDKDGKLCGCGQKGCVEMYSSANHTALEYGAKEARDVFEAAAKGDESAQAVLNKTADYLAIMCINVCRVVDPEIIIFGGGMSAAGGALLALIREHMQQRSWTILPTDVRLVVSESKQDEAGIIGAGLAALQAHLSTPVAPIEPPVKSAWDISEIIAVPRYQLFGLLSLAFIAGGVASAFGIKRFFGCTRLRK